MYFFFRIAVTIYSTKRNKAMLPNTSPDHDTYFRTSSRGNKVRQPGFVTSSPDINSRHFQWQFNFQQRKLLFACHFHLSKFFYLHTKWMYSFHTICRSDVYFFHIHIIEFCSRNVRLSLMTHFSLLFSLNLLVDSDSDRFQSSRVCRTSQAKPDLQPICACIAKR